WIIGERLGLRIKPRIYLVDARVQAIYKTTTARAVIVELQRLQALIGKTGRNKGHTRGRSGPVAEVGWRLEVLLPEHVCVRKRKEEKRQRDSCRGSQPHPHDPSSRPH